jgi:hypothetical protein
MGTIPFSPGRFLSSLMDHVWLAGCFYILRSRFSETTSEFYQTLMVPEAQMPDEVSLVVGIGG